MIEIFKKAQNRVNFGAFSLIEILISLIIISLLVAAFAPIITKKLKASDISIGSFGSGSNINMTLERQVTKEDCDKYDAIFIPAAMNGGVRNLCVTKYNMGDNDLPLADSVKKLTVGNTCTDKDKGSCCWSGKTAASCGNSGNEGSDYSGCSRTACQYQAANASCAAYAPNDENEGSWRLPVKEELGYWGSNLASINNNKGKDGLQLCGYQSSNKGSVECESLTGGCLGSQNGGCNPHSVWSMTQGSDDSSFNMYYLDGNSFKNSINNANYAFSTRCVLDKIAVDISELPNGGGIKDPTTDPFYGEPKDQADCDKIVGIFIDKKMSGANRNICVSKYNVGDAGPDGFGPPIPESFSQYIMSIGQSCPYNGHCCWKGKTAGTCGITGNAGANYSGCNRTVCQWHAANSACREYNAFGATAVGAWRLPKSSELTVWAQYMGTINNNKGPDGLQLCSHYGSSGFVQCENSSGCTGAANNSGCYPHHIWSGTSSSATNYYNFPTTTNGSLTTADYSTTAALTARCVYDGITKADNYSEDLSDYDDSNAPKDEPKSQADCDKLTAIFIHKKYAGGSRNLCMSKYNVGDSGPSGSGPKIPSTYNNYIMNVGQKCPNSGYCCWRGKTALACGITGNAGANYSGCNRTVCQWVPSNESCLSWTVNGKTQPGSWRLPTSAELTAISGYLNIINNDRGKDGLQLCSHYGSSGFVQCENSSGCTGAANNSGCYPHHIWSGTSSSATNYYNFPTTTNGSLATADYSTTAALTARCVYDGTVRKINEDDYDDINAPADEPKSQADCDKYVSIFIHKKYSSEGRNVCVTKYNVGDSGLDGSGPSIPNEYKQYFLNTGQYCGKAGYCCWKGATSGTCGILGNAGANYSGCNRTVCQWNIANAACKAHTAGGKTQAGYWRLPRSAELNSWGQNLSSINNNRGTLGLQLCSHYSYLAGFVQCVNGSGCAGAANSGGCYAHHIWTDTNVGGSNYYNYCTDPKGLIAQSYGYTAALTARCVYDGLNYSN